MTLKNLTLKKYSYSWSWLFQIYVAVDEVIILAVKNNMWVKVPHKL